MDGRDKADLESQAQSWRAELKQWENSWSEAHGGKKPTRQDIKQNPDIAQKYKIYNKARNVLAGKAPLSSLDDDSQRHRPERQSSTKRKSAAQQTLNEPPSGTPRKRLKTTATPSTARQVASIDLAITPSLSRRLFTPSALPSSIGPTPHRDGRVLGLFDLLGDTPSRLNLEGGGASSTAAGAATTPSAASRFRGVLEPPTPKAGNRKAPVATPLGTRHSVHNTPNPRQPRPPGDGPHLDEEGNKISTPSTTLSTKLRLLETPACLRRVPLPGRADEEDSEETEWKVNPLRLPPRPPGRRGLSSLIRGLRQMNEDAMDEELDVLREMEAEEAGKTRGQEDAGQSTKKRPAAAEPFAPLGTTPKKRQTAPTADRSAPAAKDNNNNSTARQGASRNVPTVEVEDSQQVDDGSAPERPVLLGAFDDEGLYDSLDEADKAQQLGRDGKPLRVFKKKGQKRTTRLVKMRPLRNRKAAAARSAGAHDDDDDDSNTDNNDGEVDRDEEKKAVPETQVVRGRQRREEEEEEGEEEEDPGLLSGSDFAMSGSEDLDDEGYREGGGSKKNKKKQVGRSETAAKTDTKGKRKAKESSKQDKGKEPKEGVVKQAVRKVKATAHANFKRLKLRNTGTKGGPGYNSKFRRRR